MNFNESKTKHNLARSFSAECQAGARYQFMATQAQNEDFCFIKDTLKMLAKNEMAHAKLFYDYIVDKCGEQVTVDINADYPYLESNLEKSLLAESKIELDEFENLYPEFAKIAEDEGFSDVANSFLVVSKVEKTHSELLKYLAKNYSNKTLYKHKNRMLMRCSNCGHTSFQSEGWTECPLCSLGGGYIEINFEEIFKNCLE